MKSFSYYFTLLLVFFFLSEVYSQEFKPDICGNPPAMQPTCLESCIICDIDGFKGRNEDVNIQGQSPPGFCTSVVHHMQWIGFIAGTSTLKISITPTNCKFNRGLEVGLYESKDCVTFSKISECDTDILPNSTRVFNNTVPLTIGNHYYFVMDGNNDDVCDYVIKVVEGSTKVEPLESAPEFTFPTSLCLGETGNFEATPLFGAVFYDWIVDGEIVGSDTKYSQTFNKAGTYNVCLEASNVCDVSPQNCKQITVIEPSTTNLTDTVCYGEFVVIGSDTLRNSGPSTIVLRDINGCDSIINHSLLVKEKLVQNTKLLICQGDSLSFHGNTYFESGMYNTIIDIENACDIYAELSVQTIDCNLTSSTIPTNTTCPDFTDGKISIESKTGTPPIHYEVREINRNVQIQTGLFTNLNENVTITDLPIGFYQIWVYDDYNNEYVEHVEINAPDPIVYTSDISDFSGYGTSCYNTFDGEIILDITGGTPPYMIKSNSGMVNGNGISNLSAGNYTIQIVDKNGCIITLNETLTAPDTINSEVLYQNPTCSAFNSGRITISSTSGGTAPYTFALENGSYSIDTVYEDLIPGIYTVTIRDKNGCNFSFQDTIESIIIPSLGTIDSILTISLGDSIQIFTFADPTTSEIVWSPLENLSCTDCLDPIASPFENTIYTITATSEDGCATSTQIRVFVDKTRSFQIADVFTPNGDNVNDKLRYFAGKDVKVIQYFKVFDRWGNLVYITEHLSPGLEEIPWDGIFNGQSLSEGVYAWVSLVTYLDDETVIYKGSLQILK
ncbi:MAG: gliding motility-associated C-terminal domain-containing protein [Saprospiraceae bacterium]